MSTGAAGTGAAAGVVLDDPVALSSQVTDTAGVLDTGAAQDAVAELSDATGVDLYVVFVDDFGGLQAQEWVTQTGSLSGLQGTDAMLAVAVQDRDYRLELPASVSTAEGQAVDQAVVQQLSADDWDGAVSAAAGTLQEVVVSEGGVGGGTVTPAQQSSGVASGLLTVALVGILGLVVVVGLVVLAARRKPALPAHVTAQRRGQTGWETLATPELEQRAGSALLHSDEALRESEQELAFARAQFGEAGTEEFQRAVTTARAQLTEAFAARHQLDELLRDRPGTPETDRRRLLVTVLQKTQVADESLQAQAESMTRLRDLERSLPTLLPALEGRAAALRADVDDAGRLLTELSTTYDAAAVEPVRDNARHGRELVEFAAARLAQARAHVAAGTAGEGALAAHEAEAALARAEEQSRAVHELQSHVRQALVQLPGATADLRADLAQAEAVLARGGDDQLAGAAGRARAAVAEADAQVQAGARPSGQPGTQVATRGGDPLGVLRRVEAADAALDEALEAMSEAGRTRAAAQAALQHASSRPVPTSRRSSASSPRAAVRSRSAPAAGPRAPASCSPPPSSRPRRTRWRRCRPRAARTPRPTRPCWRPGTRSTATPTTTTTTAGRSRADAGRAASTSAGWRSGCCWAASSAAAATGAAAAVAGAASGAAASAAASGAAASGAGAASGATSRRRGPWPPQDPEHPTTQHGSTAGRPHGRPQHLRTTRPRTARHVSTGAHMAQQSIFGRISQLARANINAISTRPRTRRRCSTR